MAERAAVPVLASHLRDYWYRTGVAVSSAQERWLTEHAEGILNGLSDAGFDVVKRPIGPDSPS